MEKQITHVRSFVYIACFVTVTLLWMFYSQVNVKYGMQMLSEDVPNTSADYLVWSKKCRIPNLSPFSEDVRHLYHQEKYVPCTTLGLLTYVTKVNNTATLHVNQSLIPMYSKDGVQCSYKTATRKANKDNPDNHVHYSDWMTFENSTTLPRDIIVVKCQSIKTKKDVYKNVHAAITITNEVQNKIDNFNKTTRPLSVLIVGIDSISRLNFQRVMPKTDAFFKENQWIEMRGYNKIGDNTFPNLMGILAGLNESSAYQICNPTLVNKLDQCNLLWYDFRKLGYVTGYAEDEAAINTFNYHKKGFVDPPVDYYFRPYVLALEKTLKMKRLESMNYCAGPETYGERILNVAKEFANTFKDAPYLGFFWMNSFSHNELNAASRMDLKILNFLQGITSDPEILKNTMVVVLSDHGLRFGKILLTRTGWLEERLPFFYLSLPAWFNKAYPEAYRNLTVNSNRLTTPYDVYMFLQDILVISGRNYTIRESEACPKCRSLFEEVEKERSCEEAGIQQHWCTCNEYKNINSSNETAKAAASFIMGEIEKIIVGYKSDYKKCVKLKLRKIEYAGVSNNNDHYYNNLTYLLVTLETVPEAVFQGTVSLDYVNGTTVSVFKLEGSISRLDAYQPHSNCVKNAILKKYCYCHHR